MKLRNLPLAFTTVALAFGAFSASGTTPALAEHVLGSLPLAIICERGSTKKLGYLAEIDKDGSATYLSANGRLALTVTPEGILKSPVDISLGSSCDGRTIEELRIDGKLIDAN